MAVLAGVIEAGQPKIQLGSYRDEISYPYMGTAVVAAGIFSDVTGLVLTNDYTPKSDTTQPYNVIRGVIVTGSGNLIVTLANQTDTSKVTIPIVVPANDFVNVKSYLIRTIHKESTCTGIFPLF